MNATLSAGNTDDTGVSVSKLWGAGFLSILVGGTGAAMAPTFPLASPASNVLDYGLTAGTTPGQLFLVPVEASTQLTALRELGAFVTDLAESQIRFDPDVSRILQANWNALFD